MKKLLIVLSFCSLVFTSCNEDGEAKSPYLEQIAGVWTLESITGNEPSDGFGGIYSSSGTSTFGYSNDHEIEVEFTENSQYSVVNSDNDPAYLIDGFFKISKDKIYVSKKGYLNQNDEFLAITEVDNSTLVVKHYILYELNGQTLPLFLSTLTFSKKI